MIVGCYCLDLYCDNELAHTKNYATRREQFTAETGGECRQQARKRGWKLNITTGKAICPACMGSKLKPGDFVKNWTEAIKSL